MDEQGPRQGGAPPQEKLRSAYHVPKTTRRRRIPRPLKKSALLTFAAACIPSAMAQNCIPLAGSTLCPAFNQSSISTNPTLVGYLYVSCGDPCEVLC